MKAYVVSWIFLIVSLTGFGFMMNKIAGDANKCIDSPPRSYQIQIESNDTFALYDGHRLVGKCFLTDDSEIGYLIIHGNK